MKLTDLAIDGYGVCRNLHLGPFSQGLNVVFGQTGSGKSTIRSFVAGVLFGTHTHTARNNYSNIDTSPGHLIVERQSERLRLWREGQGTGELHARPLDSATTMARQTVPSLIGQIDSTLYNDVFSLGFHDTRERLANLISCLHTRLGVPFGASALQDESRYITWKQRQDSVRVQIAEAQRQIDDLNFEQRRCREEIEQDERAYREQLASLDAQIADLTRQINSVLTTDIETRLAHVTDEIHRLRDALLNQETRVKYVAAPANNENYSSLYERLDEIENQIRRWRRVQTDIQAQRVRLRDEMVALERTDD